MNKVVSRRGGGSGGGIGSAQQTIVTKDVGHHPKRKSMSVSLPKNPVPFLLPLFQDSIHTGSNSHDDTTNHSTNDNTSTNTSTTNNNYYFYNDISNNNNTKRKYRVHLPTRMLCILATVFLMVPLFIFGYRETHIHAHETGPHFKVEKYVNVNTEDVLLKLSQRNSENHHQHPPPPAAVDATDPLGDPKKTLSKGTSSSKEDQEESKGEKEGGSLGFMDVLGELVKKVEENVEILGSGGSGDSETDTNETNEGNSQHSLDVPQEEQESEKGDVESPDIDSKDN